MSPEGFDPNKTLFDMINSLGFKIDNMGTNFGNKIDNVNEKITNLQVDVTAIGGDINVITNRLEDGDKTLSRHEDMLTSLAMNKSKDKENNTDNEEKTASITWNWKSITLKGGIGATIGGLIIFIAERLLNAAHQIATMHVK